MIPIAIDRLFDRLIELAKTRNERKRNFFAQFVEPVFLEYEEIHSNYVSSFRAFHERLSEPSCQTYDLLSEVRDHRMFTESHRIKLRALCRDVRDKRLSPFYYRIFRFLSTPYADEVGGQRWYQGFCNSLQEIQDFLVFSHSQKGEVDEAMLDSWYQQRLANLGIGATKEEFYGRLVWTWKLTEETRDELGRIFRNEDAVAMAHWVLKQSQFDPRLASKRVIEDVVRQMSEIHIEICEFYSQLKKELLST